MSDLFDEYCSVLGAAAGNACRCPRSALADEIQKLVGSATVWTRADIDEQFAGLTGDLTNAGVQVTVDGSPTDVRDQPWGLTFARAAIAETGSVVLHESRLEHRSVSLMTNALIVLVTETQLLASLDDAAVILREISMDGSSYATMVSGPSRTADIERQLTIGVQGPGELNVLVVTEAEA